MPDLRLVKPSPAGRLAGAAVAGLPALDAGRRVLRLDRVSLAEGTSTLPPRALGHVGYALVPSKRGLGHETRALMLLSEAKAQGLAYGSERDRPAARQRQGRDSDHAPLFAYCPPAMTDLRLLKPSRAELPQYKAALEQGWSPDNIRLGAAAKEELEKIAENPDSFLANLDDPDAKGDPIRLPDGSTVKRLPGFRRWMWDGEFVGSIGFRWQKGTSALPPYVLGHVGYSVVPWKRSRGYATKALKLLLPEAKALGLAYVELTTDAGNLVSQKVIVACGGRMIERFAKVSYGGTEGLRFQIDL